VRAVEKRRVIKEDGRYLIFYSFGARSQAAPGGPGHAAVHDMPHEAPLRSVAPGAAEPPAAADQMPRHLREEES